MAPLPATDQLRYYARRSASYVKRRIQRVEASWARRRGDPVVHFLHVGKTGGIALGRAIVPYERQGGRIILWHPHETSLRDVPVGEKVFLVLRDPLDRIRSAYKARQRQGGKSLPTPAPGAERDVFSRYPSLDALGQALGSAEAEERHRAETAFHSVKHLQDHYGHWLVSHDYVRERRDDILLICRQERLATDFEALKQKLGLPAHAALSTDAHRANRAPAGKEAALSAEGEAGLRRILAEDYELIAFLEREGLLEPLA
ncbi:MAG: hypothetical protein AAF416_13625 [Pseudomonadota bacterium]